MMIKNISKNTQFLIKITMIVVVIFFLDQWTKNWIIENLSLYEKISISNFFNLTHQQNTGAAFSFLAEAGGWQRWFLSIVAMIVSGYIAYWLYELKNSTQWFLIYGLSLVLGGALGNVFDRIRLGYVTDFLQVFIGNWPFPSFNIADAAITIGAIFIIIDAIIETRSD
ncbi:MAG: signal peptidase II [Woeseiaceae bacterium]|jgi:signal peptidase II|nr:signal peptidase II [Woeseiaceae bacterium]MDG1865158.1 signal peptidase II [Woeseiaceae bacterium]